MSPRMLSVAVLAALLLAPAASRADEPETAAPAEGPQKSGLIERTGRRLAQLDVTVRGPADQIADLTRDDFELVVGGSFFDEFLVDRVCREPAGEAVRRVEKIETVGEPAAAAPVASILFYFDLSHLTQAGWNRSVQMMQELIPELIRDGNRGMIVSSGEELTTYAELTSDAEELLAALDRFVDDGRWDPYSQLESQRIEEIQVLAEKNLTAGIHLARRYQREEAWHTSRALQRFSMVLGRLASLDPPKVVVYFADTMRSTPGAHYANLFPRAQIADSPDLRAMGTREFMSASPFHRAIDEAAAHGVRLYTIHAQGLSAPWLGESAEFAGTRVRQAEDSLKGFALETGGQAFIGGYRTKSIISTIREDLSCLYLISFDPAGLPRDTGLPVRVRVSRPKVTAQVRGRIVLQSDTARLTSRLLAAFGAPSAMDGQSAIGSSLVPAGFQDGKFRALLQVFVPGAPVSGASWDLGASIVADDKLLDEPSGHVEVSGAGVPVILETEVEFKPGPYSVVAVAHENTSDQTASRETRGEWPNPKEQPATVTPIAIVQPAAGVFLRDGAVRNSGARAAANHEPVRVDVPTAFIGMVCWDGVQKATLKVERTLSGDSSAEFAPMAVEPNADRCAYFRDLVQAGTMTEGVFTYRVTVRSKDVELARAERAFAAVDPRAASPADGAAPDG